jgi:predicted amidophosphoribosyltransferase
MQCIRCGKEMVNTTGGNYHCPSCNMAINDLVYRPSEWKPFPQDFGKQEGWVCPVCGRGVAPWVDYCPCRGSELNITYGTTTYTNKDVEQYEQYSINNC